MELKRPLKALFTHEGLWPSVGLINCDVHILAMVKKESEN